MNGKQKGAGYERKVCVELSRWVSGGTREDLYWRSAMSGGRATLGARKGKDLRRQSGDINSVSPEGHVLTDRFYIELKAYKDLCFDRFFIEGTGKLAKFWLTTVKEAAKHKKQPMLIARQNLVSAILVVPARALFGCSETPLPVATLRMGCDVYLYHEVISSRFIGSKLNA